LAILAEQVRRSLRAPIDIAGQNIVLTASIGISLYDGPDDDPAELLREAMIAMYRAKRMGTDRIEIFSAEMRRDKEGRVALEAELRRALEKKQIRVAYQPIFYLATEVLAGFELQLFWDHPSQGTLDPSHFMPIAEDSDLVLGLGSFVLTQALRDVARWQKELPRPDLPVFASVNLASRQLFRPELAQELRRLLARAVVPKGSLRLEIPEALIMENPEKATSLLAQLADTGAGLSLDDFGTGFSSLSYLSQFSFDAIKVDAAFIQAGSQNGAGSVILRSVVALSHELGKAIVTEGVETEEDVAFLRSIGCEYGQGPYFGAPMAEREVLHLIKVARKVERRMKKSALFRRRQRPAEEPPPPPPLDVPIAAKPALLSPPAAAAPSNGSAARAPEAGAPAQPATAGPPKLDPRQSERRPRLPPPLPPARPGARPPPPGLAPQALARGGKPQPVPPPATVGKRAHGPPPPPRVSQPPAPAPSAPLPRAKSAPPPPRNGGQPPVATRPAAAPAPPPLPSAAPPPTAPRPNGRPGADFSALPPAIAESLARLAGRQTAPPVTRDVAETDSAGPANKPPQP
jgi:EAL domain-containing protein (putative c-di-GMP-specific phosphodiesterase class I)